MGIEDLQDLTQESERILLISENISLQSKIEELCKLRNYSYTSVSDIAEAETKAKAGLFDLIIFFCGDESITPVDYFADIKDSAFLRRTPLILLHKHSEKYQSCKEFSPGANCVILPDTVTTGSLFVKVSALLRLFKLKGQEAEAQSKLAAQNAQLKDLTNRFKNELKEAQNIQKSLMPSSLPETPRCDFASIYKPLEAVGGDLYDIWQESDNLYGLLIGDVTGHGLPAAFIGAMTKMAMSYARKTMPDEMFSDINAGLVPHMPEGRFVTMSAAFFNTESGELNLVRGGHPPAYLWRRDSNEVEIIQPRGLPVGVIPMAKFENYNAKVSPGDRLLMITDGMVEAQNRTGEMIGIERIGTFLKDAAKIESMQEVLEYVLKCQDSFCEGRLIKDDNTLIGFEYISE